MARVGTALASNVFLLPQLVLRPRLERLHRGRRWGRGCVSLRAVLASVAAAVLIGPGAALWWPLNRGTVPTAFIGPGATVAKSDDLPFHGQAEVLPMNQQLEPGTLGRRGAVLSMGTHGRALLAAGLGQPVAAWAKKRQVLEGRVVRPKEGPPLYSFELPSGNRFSVGEVTDLNINLFNLDIEGSTIDTGPVPYADFVKKQKENTPPFIRKVLKFNLGEKEDIFECKVKYLQEDGSFKFVHRWYRAIREIPGERSALMILEVPEDNMNTERLIMEGILNSFRLGA